MTHKREEIPTPSLLALQNQHSSVNRNVTIPILVSTTSSSDCDIYKEQVWEQRGAILESHFLTAK